MKKPSDTQDAAGDRGHPAIDPTANVLKLVEKAVERMDDLRTADDKWNERVRTIQEKCDDEKADLRQRLVDAEARRIDAVNLAEARRIDAVMAEQKAAVALASERATAQAATLAQSVVASAEALRAQAAASTAATTEAIRVLERNQYQTSGRDTQRGEAKTDFKSLIGWALAVPGIIYIIVTLTK